MGESNSLRYTKRRMPSRKKMENYLQVRSSSGKPKKMKTQRLEKAGSQGFPRANQPLESPLSKKLHHQQPIPQSQQPLSNKPSSQQQQTPLNPLSNPSTGTAPRAQPSTASSTRSRTSSSSPSSSKVTSAMKTCAMRSARTSCCQRQGGARMLQGYARLCRRRSMQRAVRQACSLTTQTGVSCKGQEARQGASLGSGWLRCCQLLTAYYSILAAQIAFNYNKYLIHRRGQVKSNFIKYTPPAPAQPSSKEEEPLNDKENTNSTNLESTATTVAEPEKPKNVDLPRHNRQLCHLNLESMNQIFRIY